MAHDNATVRVPRLHVLHADCEGPWSRVRAGVAHLHLPLQEIGASDEVSRHFSRPPFCSIAGKKKKRSYKIDKEHVAWITKQSTLVEQAGFSLAHRCKLFHRKFPDRWTNPTALANLYRKHGIKMKKVRMAKSTGK